MKINELNALSEEKFIIPSIEVVLFDNVDVITASPTNPDEFETPEDVFPTGQ